MNDIEILTPQPTRDDILRFIVIRGMDDKTTAEIHVEAAAGSFPLAVETNEMVHHRCLNWLAWVDSTGDYNTHDYWHAHRKGWVTEDICQNAHLVTKHLLESK